MTEQSVTIYREPRRDAGEGEALLRCDVARHYWLNNVKVVTIEPRRDFTALTCIDCATHYVRTGDFQCVCPETLQVVYCSCGHLVVGLDAAHLFDLARTHNDTAHPDNVHTDEEILAVITANAFALDHLQPT